MRHSKPCSLPGPCCHDDGFSGPELILPTYVMLILKHSMRRYGFFDLAGSWISRWSCGRLARSPRKRVGPHTLRRSYPRHLLMHDVPINYLSRWLGHSSSQATLI